MVHVKELKEAIEAQDQIIKYYLNIKKTYQSRKDAILMELQEVQARLDELEHLHDSADSVIERCRKTRSVYEHQRRVKSVAAGGVYPAERRKPTTPEEKLRRMKAQVELLEQQIANGDDHGA